MHEISPEDAATKSDMYKPPDVLKAENALTPPGKSAEIADGYFLLNSNLIRD